MSISGISEVFFNSVNKPKETSVEQNVSEELIFNFTENNNTDPVIKISQSKWETEMFTNRNLRKLCSSVSDDSCKNKEFYLRKLIEVVQILNGIQENNLKPNGNAEQNRFYNIRIKDFVDLLKDYKDFIGSGLRVMQDSKTGLYNFVINDRLYDVPKRKVEIQEEETLDRIELMPKIVD